MAENDNELKQELVHVRSELEAVKENQEDVDRRLFGGPRAGPGFFEEFNKSQAQQVENTKKINDFEVTVRVLRGVLAFFGLTTLSGVLALIYLLLGGVPK